MKPWENIGVSREEWELSQQVLPPPGEMSYKELAREAVMQSRGGAVEVEVEVTLENGVRALFRGPKFVIEEEIARLKREWRHRPYGE